MPRSSLTAHLMQWLRQGLQCRSSYCLNHIKKVVQVVLQHYACGFLLKTDLHKSNILSFVLSNQDGRFNGFYKRKAARSKL